MTEQKYWHVTMEDRVAILTVSNPPANALSTPVVMELDETVARLNADDEVGAVVLTGAGMFFIAGADIKEIQGIQDAPTGSALAAKGQRVLDRIEQAPKPYIAAINGMCLGGGNELAMACHMRIASDRAKLGQPEINLGIIPGFAGSQRLSRLVGRGKALELLLTGDMIPAKLAHQIGLVNVVVPSAEVLKVAKGLARKISRKGARAVAAILQVVREGLDVPLAEGQAVEAELFGAVCATEDMKEGISAFLEKRQPRFQHR